MARLGFLILGFTILQLTFSATTHAEDQPATQPTSQPTHYGNLPVRKALLSDANVRIFSATFRQYVPDGEWLVRSLKFKYLKEEVRKMIRVQWMAEAPQVLQAREMFLAWADDYIEQAKLNGEELPKGLTAASLEESFEKYIVRKLNETDVAMIEVPTDRGPLTVLLNLNPLSEGEAALSVSGISIAESIDSQAEVQKGDSVSIWKLEVTRNLLAEPSLIEQIIKQNDAKLISK